MSVLVPGDPRCDDPLDWGLYPMVPYAGRLRHGELPWRGETYHLPRRRPPHAIHGTVLDTEWNIVSLSPSACTLSTPLGTPWPFSGRVDHDITLTDSGLDLRLTVHAEVDMPVQIGWHPWFHKTSRLSLPFRSIHRRDDAGVAESFVTPIDTSTWNREHWSDVDDCFTDLDGGLTIQIDSLVVHLSSTCEHWVVFDQPPHATCVEPQSGPPNVLAVDPTIVRSGESRHESFSLSWDSISRGDLRSREISDEVSARSSRLVPLTRREGSEP